MVQSYYLSTYSFYSHYRKYPDFRIFSKFNLLFIFLYIILRNVESDFLQPLINYLYSPQNDQWLPHWSFYFNAKRTLLLRAKFFFYYTSNNKSPYDGIGHISLFTIISKRSTGARREFITGTTSVK